jgi:hypothetical protein
MVGQVAKRITKITMLNSSTVQKVHKMATVNFRLRSKANKNVSIKVVTLNRGNDLELNTGFTINQRLEQRPDRLKQNNTKTN